MNEYHEKLIEDLQDVANSQIGMYNELDKEKIEEGISAIEELLARAEKAESERDAAIKYIRHYGWCAGCKDFKGIRGCAGVGLKNCTEQNDHYEFVHKEE